jgi:glycosyltransferase involved in cell wall biosynthesis
LFKFIGERLPFGCHAWRKFQYNDFWRDYIKTTGSVMKQKVSIITINYNNLEGLKSTRDSIVCQTYSNYEWIVIDGGSNDGAKDYLTEHTSEISYWCSEKDSGVYNAQNKGLMKASGDYLIFMNSGDTFHSPSVLKDITDMQLKEDIITGSFYDKEKK